MWILHWARQDWYFFQGGFLKWIKVRMTILEVLGCIYDDSVANALGMSSGSQSS